MIDAQRTVLRRPVELALNWANTGYWNMNEAKETENKEYNQGIQTHVEGMSRNSNPYSLHSPEYEAWAIGWQESCNEYWEERMGKD
jgi:ribosome modulation factor